jgi:uncharacterized small protein (DUF1192 family)
VLPRIKLVAWNKETAMASIDEDPFGAPARKKIIHEPGENLDLLSAHELRERIEFLRVEIVRLEQAVVAKEASRRAADAFFKS